MPIMLCLISQKHHPWSDVQDLQKYTRPSQGWIEIEVRGLVRSRPSFTVLRKFNIFLSYANFTYVSQLLTSLDNNSGWNERRCLPELGLGEVLRSRSITRSPSGQGGQGEFNHIKDTQNLDYNTKYLFTDWVIAQRCECAGGQLPAPSWRMRSLFREHTGRQHLSRTWPHIYTCTYMCVLYTFMFE